MDVLVLGGTRFFGKLVVEQLVAAGHTVTVFSRGNLRPAVLRQVRHIAGDRRDRAAFEARFATERFDAVFDNLAFSAADVESAIRAFAGRIGQYVLTSTAAVYDLSRGPLGQRPYCEEDADLEYVPPGFDGSDPGAAYAVGKRQAERALQRAQGAPFPWTVVRPPFVIGPEDYTQRTWWYVQRVLDGGPIPLPEEQRGFVSRHVFSADLAAGIVRLIGNPVATGRAYNLAQEELVSPATFLQAIGQAAGRAVEIVWVPRAVLEAAGLGDHAGPFATPIVQEICAARRDLSWRSRPFAEWIARTVAWHQAHPYPPSAGYDRRDREVEVARRYQAGLAELAGRG